MECQSNSKYKDCNGDDRQADINVDSIIDLICTFLSLAQAQLLTVIMTGEKDQSASEAVLFVVVASK